MREKLTDIPNVGKRVARDLEIIGVKKLADLRGRDPLKLYQKLCKITGIRHDPCMLDTFMAAVDYANGAPKTPWWFYTPERKKKYPKI